MGFQISGVVRKVFETKQVSDKFTKREFVIEHGDKYPQLSMFELAKDRCSMLDDVNEGDTVSVEFDLRGREWSKGGETKYFNSLNAWKVTVTAKGAPRSSPVDGRGTDDLPF